MADQFWGDELFVHGPAPALRDPSLYISIEPWTVNPEPTTGYSLKVSDGQPWDGYQFNAGLDEGRAAFVRRAGVDDFSSWCVERQGIRDTADVKLIPSMLVLGGRPDFDTFRQFGVCTHVTGGTSTLPGADEQLEYFTNVSGYFLIETKNAATRHRVLLLEVVAGAITVLGSENVRDTDPAHNEGSAITYFDPRPLRLRVVKSGGTATLTAYRTTNGGQEVQLFGTNFVRGTPLADGRCGFGMQTLRTSTGGCKAVGVAEEFTVKDGAGAIQFNDRFRRLQRRAAMLVASDGINGHSLASAWVGDAKSRRVTAGIDLALQFFFNPARLNQVEWGFDTGSGAWPGFMLRQDAPTTREQRYAANIMRLNAETDTRTEMGLLLRFTATPYPSGQIELRGRFPAAPAQIAGHYKDGYIVYVVHDTSATPVWQLEVRHHEFTTTQFYEGDVLATVDLTSAGLLVGTAFELDVEIRNTDGNSFGQGGFVSIESKINGTTVTPVSTGLAGISVIDDRVIDTRSVATTEAGGIGMYGNPNSKSNSNDLISFLDVAAKTLSAPPKTDPNEQASVPVAAENANLVGFLGTPVVDTLTEELVATQTIHRFEGGKVQTIGRHPLTRTRYSLQAVFEDDAMASFLSLKERAGNHSPFQWQHPYTGEFKFVIFVSEEMQFDQIHIEDGRCVHTVSFQLDELFPTLVYNPAP